MTTTTSLPGQPARSASGPGTTAALFDLPADLDTPVGAYRKLQPLAPKFLFESVVHGESRARYSWIGLGCGETYRLRNGALTTDRGATERDSTDIGSGADSTHAFRALLQAAPNLAASTGRGAEDLPFRGGLVGACGFDLARRLQRRPNQQPRAGHASGDLSEAVFHAPKSVLVFDHVTHRAALLHDGTTQERDRLHRDIRKLMRGSAPTGETAATPRQTLSERTLDVTRDEFLDRVATAKGAIRDGEVYQLVLSAGFSGQIHADPLQIYRALRLLNPSPYMFLLQLGGDEGTLIGSSPEVLTSSDGRRATLRPIAGTRPRGRSPAEDLALEAELRADPKEAAEHVMLVDLARNDCGRVAKPGSVHLTDDRIIERYSHVMHLVSGVEGELEPPHDAIDLFAAAFPAGTVSGAPKTRALELIESLEATHRGFYGGTVGWFGHGASPSQGCAADQALTIRTLHLRGDEYRYRAGAGIVDASDPNAEFEEVLAKARVLDRALTLAAESEEL